MILVRWLVNTIKAGTEVPRDLFPDDVIYIRARATRALLLAGLLINLVSIAAGLFSSQVDVDIETPITIAFASCSLAAYLYLRRGPKHLVRAGRFLLLLYSGGLLWGILSALGGFGTLQGSLSAIPSAPVMVLVAGLCLSRRALIISTALVGLSLGILALQLTFGEHVAKVMLEAKQVRTLVLALLALGVALAALLLLLTSVLDRMHAARKAAEAAQSLAEERAQKLHKLDAVKTEFFNNVSHEFRTPITLALGELAELKQNASEVAGISHQLHRLLKLVNAILEFSSLQSGTLGPSFERLDLATLTAELCSEFRSAFRRAGLHFEVSCNALPGEVEVYADRRMWEKIVLNLLTNALKFTLQGSVKVTLKVAKPFLVLEVQDTGIGISPADQQHVFERFYRVPGAKGRTHEGSGIGLSLVSDLVQLHHGKVEVESIQSQGSTFRILLPLGSEHLPMEQVAPASTHSPILSVEPFLKEAMYWLERKTPNTPTHALSEGPIALPSPLPPSIGSSQRQRILLVDDDVDMLSYLVRIVGEKYEVSGISDGAAALASMKQAPPDLVLTDVMMSGMDGLTLLSMIRNDPKLAPIPVVILTARGGEDRTLDGLSRLADDYMVKPFSVRELLARIHTHLKLSQVRKEGVEHRDRIMNIVSHELRNSLTVLKSSTDLAHRQARAGERVDDELWSRLRRGLIKVEVLANDLTDVVRIESGQIALRLVPSDLRGLIVDAVDDQEATADRDIEFLDTIPGQTVRTKCDPARIGQILHNLLGNALKYTPPPGAISIRLGCEPNSAVIDVIDHGPGIPEEELGKIFQCFYRVPGTTGPGLGVGLYICRQLAELHGGTLTVESAVAKGTTFHLRLPLCS